MACQRLPGCSDVNAVSMEPVKLEGNEIDEVESFTYLGSIIDKHGGTDADVKGRISKARGAFIQLKNTWSSNKMLSLHIKIRLFNSNVKSVLLYGAETWMTTNTTTKILQTFINNCLRRFLQIRWPNTTSNNELWEKSHQQKYVEKTNLTDIKRTGYNWRELEKKAQDRRLEDCCQ